MEVMSNGFNNTADQHSCSKSKWQWRCDAFVENLFHPLLNSLLSHKVLADLTISHCLVHAGSGATTRTEATSEGVTAERIMKAATTTITITTTTTTS
jgi:hypothetical protein